MIKFNAVPENKNLAVDFCFNDYFCHRRNFEFHREILFRRCDCEICRIN